MQNFIKHFVRERGGRWVCVEPATLDLPQGRVQVVAGTVFMRGTRFMNIDIAEMLDREYEAQTRQPPRPERPQHPG